MCVCSVCVAAAACQLIDKTYREMQTKQTEAEIDKRLRQTGRKRERWNEWQSETVIESGSWS